MKNIVTPSIEDYPAVVSGLAFSIGDHVRKGDRICVLTLSSGRKIAINAPVSGQIKLLMVRDGNRCGGSQMLAAIDNTVVAPKAAPTPPPKPSPEPSKPAQAESVVQKQKARAPRRPRRTEAPTPPTPPSKQINFFLWQGWGWLVPIVYVASALIIFTAMAFWMDGDSDPLIYSKWLQALAFLTPAFVVGWFGLWTNSRKSAVANNRVSKFLFLRSEYWAVPLVIVAICGMVFIDLRLRERAAEQAMMEQLSDDLAASNRDLIEYIDKLDAERIAEEAEDYRNARYSFTLCNRTNRRVFAAIAIKDNGNAEHMRMQAWYQISPNDCLAPLTGLFQDTSETEAYYYAYNNWGGIWQGRAGESGTIDFCLPLTRQNFLLFNRLRCRGRQELRTFDIIKMTRDQPVYRMNLR